MLKNTVIAATLSLLTFLFPTRTTEAALRSWQDNGDNPDWSFVLNWSPIGTPSLTDNIVLGSLAAEDTIINQNFTIDTLAITNGATADSDDNRLSVIGDVLISGAGSKFIARENTTGSSSVALDADDLTLLSGAVFESLTESQAHFGGNFTINAGAHLQGNGQIRAGHLINNGTIAAMSATTVFNLIISGTGTFNLDGTNENGIVEAIDGDITIHDPLLDPFDGTITIGADRQLGFVAGGTIGSGGVVNLQGSSTLQAKLSGFSTATADIAGTVHVSRQAQVSDVRFLSGASVNLVKATDLLTIRGPASTIESGATFSGSGQIIVRGGTLTLGDGAQVTVPVIVGNTASGTLRIGNGIAAAEVLTYEPNFGTLEIELGGTGFNEYDRLTASISASLDGELDVSLINGFMPRGGDGFQILSTLGSITGQFDTTTAQLPSLPSGLSWSIDYSDLSHVFLRVSSFYSADFDGDGDVDGDDLIDPVDGWQARYGNDLDGADFLTWQRQLGILGAPGLASSQAVPEPASLALAFVSLSLFLRRHRYS